MRANVFRFAPESGHRAMQSACPFRAHNRTSRPLHSMTSSARANPPIQPDGFFFDFAARGAMLTVSLSIRRDQCTRRVPSRQRRNKQEKRRKE